MVTTPTIYAIDLTGPFDAHGHLRRGDKPGQMLHTVVRDLFDEFCGMLVMGNPQPPIITTGDATGYAMEIARAMPENIVDFTWLLTCFLTDETKFDDLLRGIEEDIWVAAKYLPANGSTNTALAVTALEKIFPLLEKVQTYSALRRRKKRIPILLHPEVVGDDIDPFDAERIFFDKKLPMLQRNFPGVLFVAEHISTKEGAWYVRDQPFGEIYATLTPQHLLHTRKRIFQSGRIADGTFRRGLNPSMVCWPLLKEESDRQAILKLIASGNSHIGLGTDRAPHPWEGYPSNQPGKLGDCGAAGCYPGRYALGMYAMGFEEAGALPYFPDFACWNIPCNVYELPQGKKKIRLVKDAQNPITVPRLISLDGDSVVHMMHDEKIPWRIAREEETEKA